MHTITISAFTENTTWVEGVELTEQLVRDINKPVTYNIGTYNGIQELSVTFNINDYDDMKASMELLKQYKQESLLYVDWQGFASLVYTNGDVEPLGVYKVTTNATGDYTIANTGLVYHVVGYSGEGYYSQGNFEFTDIIEYHEGVYSENALKAKLEFIQSLDVREALYILDNGFDYDSYVESLNELYEEDYTLIRDEVEYAAYIKALTLYV